MTARLPALTAASTRLYLDVGPAAATDANRSKAQPWQDMAWYYRDHLPEANYAVRFIGNCLSRIRLYPAIQLNPDEPLSSLRNDDGTPADGVDERLVAAAEHSLRRLRNSEEGQAGILRKLGEIQAVSGEPLLVGRHLGTGDEDWAVYSESEVVHKDGQWRLKERPDDRDGTPLDIGTPEKPGADFVLRIWTKHARWSGLADSPMRGVLDICEELTLWGKAMRATAMSRLSNGVFIIDEAITFPGPREPVVDGEFDEGAGGPDADDDSFEREMLDHFTTPIADQGSASAVVPFIKRVQPPDGRTVKDCVAWLQSERPIDRDIVARIEHLRTRFAAGVDLPTEILTGMGDMNHWCMDSNTQVFSPTEGWLSVDEVEVGRTHLLTLDHETGLTRTEPVVDKYVADVADEPMLSIEGRYHSSLTTMDHSWPVVDKRHGRVTVKSRDLAASVERRGAFNSRSDYQLLRGAPSGTLPTTAKYEDDLVELVAWMFTEGGLSYREGAEIPHRVAIYQSHAVNGDNCDRIRAALTRLYGPARLEVKVGRPTRGEEELAWWREVKEGRCTRFVLSKAAWLPIVEHCPHRIVAREFVEALTLAQLELFLLVAVLGDGHRMAGKTPVLGQKNPAMLDAAEYAAILAGYAVNRWAVEHDGFHRHTQHYLTWTRRNKFRFGKQNVREVQYTGRIWCPTVAPTHTVLARRDGKAFWTGQSAWQVEESTYKVHIEPKLVALTNPLSAGYVHWDLLSQGFTAEEVQPIVVGYDPSDLVVRPNRGENALQAYDRFELSGDGLRTYLAIPDQYKPDQEEIDERLRRSGIGTTGDTSDQPIPANNPQITGGEPREKPDAATHRLRPLTASSVRPLGERLADIDRRLLSRLHVACDDAVNDAVRKAGSKLRAKAQGFTDARSQLRNVAAADVGRVLTADWVQGVGVTDDELFGDSFDALGDRYDTWVGSAQAQARRAAGVDSDELAASQEEDRKAGWGLLAGLLSTLAASLLYGTPPPVEGEQAAGLTVPAGYVRQGLARAGGVTDPQGRPSGTNPGATTGVATGPTVATALATIGQVVDGWTWDYGDPGDRAHPFEPHEALDGLSFTGWDDEVLDSTDSPFGPGFVGDHDGCLCQAIPNIVDSSALGGDQQEEAA